MCCSSVPVLIIDRPQFTAMKRTRQSSRRTDAGRQTSAPDAPVDARQLNKSQLRHLRSLAHSLKPVVRLGAQGLVTGVRRELDIALLQHELVKVKLAGATREAREEQLQSLAHDAGATVIQSIGSTAVLFRRNRRKPKIHFEANAANR